MKFFLVLICSIFIPNAIYAYDEDIDEIWEIYKMKFNKSYPNRTDDAIRKKYFEENHRIVQQHNLEEDLGMHTFRLGLNFFSDLSPEELGQIHGRCLFLADNLESQSKRSDRIIREDIPEAVDWRQEQVLTSVKDQGGCGSCWAFATTGALEAQISHMTGELTSLSEQNLVDCAKEYGGPAHGCRGGTLTDGFKYVIRNGGIDTEEFYPYHGKEEECHFSESNIGGTCTDYVYIRDSEDEVLEVVATIGPVAASIDAGPYDFKYYTKGIYSSDKCDAERVNHAVLIVGYGKSDGVEYWIIKNSWGPRWGYDGYMYIKRNAPFMCGIGKSAVYPVL